MVHLPTGPVVEFGVANFQKYSLRCNPPLDMDTREIIEYLTKCGIKVKEIIFETEYNQPLPCGGIKIYAGFTNTNAALNFPRTHIINERQVSFRHVGALKCETCGEQGHLAEK